MVKRVGWMVVAATLAACSTIESVKLPPKISGQIPNRYRTLADSRTRDPQFAAAQIEGRLLAPMPQD